MLQLEHLAELAARRRAEFQGYDNTPAPPDRFQTRGPIHRHAHFESTAPAPTTESSPITAPSMMMAPIPTNTRS